MTTNCGARSPGFNFVILNPVPDGDGDPEVLVDPLGECVVDDEPAGVLGVCEVEDEPGAVADGPEDDAVPVVEPEGPGPAPGVPPVIVA